MYSVVLSLHSLLRWVVVILAVVAVVRAFVGWFCRRAWTPFDDRLGLSFLISMDVQVLLGLILYVLLSPLTREAFQDLGKAMSDAILRFWAFEHLFFMVVVLALVHIGRVRAKGAAEAIARHRRAAIFFGLALVLLLLAIPWPFLAVGSGRPWIRL